MFHKTLPKSSLQIYWISVRFYEMGNSIIILSENLKFETYQSLDVDMYTFYKQVETIL